MEVLCLVEYDICVVIVMFRVVVFGFCAVELCRGNGRELYGVVLVTSQTAMVRLCDVGVMCR